MADIVDLILKHENLAEGQTPFRITSPEMAKWNTVLGYKVSKKEKPKGRENFIFLDDPSQVKAAVKEQLKRYYQIPVKYKLPSEPTIEQAVRVFDQSGAKGKLKLLQDAGIDTKQPLRSHFEQTALETELLRQMGKQG
jgi:hypothetical protein